MVRTSDNFISLCSWLRYFVAGKDLILRGVSALEYLGFFVGYWGESEIEVYAKNDPHEENISCIIVDGFENIDYERHGDVLCSSLTQAINDLLEDPKSDDLALAQALADYYFSHNDSFDGLTIYPQNVAEFERMKEWATLYYS